MTQDNRNKNADAGNQSGNRNNQDSVGNQQSTSQTGAQNAGGENRDQQEDRYAEDLRKSGDRSSSNKKKSS